MHNIKKKLIIGCVFVVMMCSLIGCSNNPTLEKGEYTIKNADSNIVIKDLDLKDFSLNKLEDDLIDSNSIAFETDASITTEKYEKIQYTVVNKNQFQEDELFDRINTVIDSYSNYQEYYKLDEVNISEVETINSNIGTATFKYMIIPVVSESKTTVFQSLSYIEKDDTVVIIDYAGMTEFKKEKLKEYINYIVEVN